MKELCFEHQALLFSIENLLLVLFQGGNGVALGVDKGLFLFVIGGNLVAVGAADFDVVAEHLVETHLERLDGGGSPLLLLNLQKPVFGGRGN